ncbi:hypothetical protein ACEZ3G_10405 [Maribacter algicola]|uniref:Uncharacterized protein n=1 Tax=Meishania litoralis TaxID=3434685 RepID=A0ACC7LJF5_9FLAO
MNQKNSTIEKVGLKDPYTKEDADSKKQTSIVELLKRKPAVYEV